MEDKSPNDDFESSNLLRLRWYNVLLWVSFTAGGVALSMLLLSSSLSPGRAAMLGVVGGAGSALILTINRMNG